MEEMAAHTSGLEPLHIAHGGKDTTAVLTTCVAQQIPTSRQRSLLLAAKPVTLGFEPLFWERETLRHCDVNF